MAAGPVGFVARRPRWSAGWSRRAAPARLIRPLAVLAPLALVPALLDPPLAAVVPAGRCSPASAWAALLPALNSAVRAGAAATATGPARSA